MLKLRSQGFKPSNANRQAIAKALDHRPNQAPLIEALKETLAYQRKLQAQMQDANAGQPPGYNFGVNQPPPGQHPSRRRVAVTRRRIPAPHRHQRLPPVG